MAMTKESMAAYIQGHLDAIDHSQTNNVGEAQSYQNDVLLAFCQGIIDEIQSNAVVTTISGAPDGEHTGEID